MISNKELLMVADLLSKEKGISQEEVLNALADGMETALRKDFPEGAVLSVVIDNVTGDLVAYRKFQLVDQIENVESEMLLSEVEDEIIEDSYAYEEFVPKLDRQKYNIAKQVATQKIKQGSRESQIADLLSKPVALFTGIVKVANKEKLIADLNGLDITIWRRNLLPRENFKAGEKITFTLEKDKNQYFGTRISDDYLREVFKREIFQIEDGDIEIVSLARNPGFRSKVIVKSNSRNVNPMVACLGPKGSHIKTIQSYLNGESIDVYVHDDNLVQQLIDVIAPVNVTHILVDEDTQTMDVVVADSDIGMAIGKGSKNVEMISKLLGWKLNVASETQWQNNSSNTNEQTIAIFQKALNCDRDIAETLVAEGFSSLEEIAYVPSHEFQIDGFDNELIENLKANAKLTLDDADSLQKVESMGELVLLGFNEDEIQQLNKENVFNNSDVSDLGTLDLTDILTELDEEKAKDFIMKARSKDQRFQEAA